MKKNIQTNGVTSFATRVAFALSRAITSHARTIYVSRYTGTHRYARYLFALDAFLVGSAVTLASISLVLLFISPVYVDGGLHVKIDTGIIRGSEEFPMTITIRAHDSKIHTAVSLRLELPEWVEIIRTDPAMKKDGSIDLGTITSRISASTNIVLRARASRIELKTLMHVHQDDAIGFVRDMSMIDIRHVGDSVLSVTPSSTLFTVHNSSLSDISSVIFRITHATGCVATIGGLDSYALGRLKGGDSRDVFVNVSSPCEILYQLQDGAQSVLEGVGMVLATDTVHILNRFPYKTFPVYSEVRYFSKSHDQIGVGPNPAVVGKTSTFWAAIIVGPTLGVMKNIVLNAQLSAGVRATGKYASNIDTEFENKQSEVIWKIKSMPAIDAEKISFAFEITVTPNRNTPTSTSDYIGLGYAHAEDEYGNALIGK